MNYSFNPSVKYNSVGTFKLGDVFFTTDKPTKAYKLIYDSTETSYPFILLCLDDAISIQSFDELPTIEDIEENIGEIKFTVPKEKLLLVIN